MFREEMKKLFVKQYGIIVMAILLVCEIIFTGFLYQRYKPVSEYSGAVFNEYMTEFSGELTDDKMRKILAEQELILNATNAESELEARLYKGEFTNRNEFRAEYNELHTVAMRSDALDKVLEKYYYALEDTQNRFILSGNYDGLGQDFPDVFMLAAIIIITAAAFLNEESSNVSTLIRTSENGRKSAFKCKAFALLIFICACQFIRMICEFVVMISRGNIAELMFPVQSIPCFQNCQYNLTIVQCFLAISLLKLLGYFFVASLVMLLAVKIKTPLFTVFIPCAICILQQFAFEPAALAYCIPTGLLRTSGYLGGNLSSGSKVGADPIEIPIELLFVVLFSTFVFITISIIIAEKYYSCKKHILKCKSAILSATIVIICCTCSGCAKSTEKSVVYNLEDNFFYAEDDDYYFISDNNGITRHGKDDCSEFQIIRDPFLSNAGLYGMAICENDLYCLDAFESKEISVISLDTLSETTFNTEKMSEFSVYSAFTNGVDLFFSTFDESGIYKFQNNKICKIISEKIYNNQLCFDGRKIFYINSLLELNCYDTLNDKQTVISEDFARAVYYDGKRVLYSTDKGVFALDNNTLSGKNLSEAVAEKISSDGDKIVFLKDGKLFYLGDEIIEIYDKEPLCFALLPETGKVLLRQYDHKINKNIDICIDLPLNCSSNSHRNEIW